MKVISARSKNWSRVAWWRSITSRVHTAASFMREMRHPWTYQLAQTQISRSILPTSASNKKLRWFVALSSMNPCANSPPLLSHEWPPNMMLLKTLRLTTWMHSWSWMTYPRAHLLASRSDKQTLLPRHPAFICITCKTWRSRRWKCHSRPQRNPMTKNQATIQASSSLFQTKRSWLSIRAPM